MTSQEVTAKCMECPGKYNCVFYLAERITDMEECISNQPVEGDYAQSPDENPEC